MIQRPQTFFLILAILSNLGVYFTPIYDRAMEDPQLWIGIGLATSLLIAMVLAGFCISLYKDRQKQISWIKKTMFMQVIGLGFATGVFFSLGGIGTYLWDEGVGLSLIVIALTFEVLALRGVKKDEELVRSMDRIR